MTIEQTIVELVKSYDQLQEQEKKGAPGQAILKDIRLIGNTAAFYGGYDAMKRLHDAAEYLVGENNSVGYYLNYMWDGIGDWCS